MKKKHLLSQSCFIVLLLMILTVATPERTNADIIGTARALPIINVFQDITWNVISSQPLTMAGFTVERPVAVTWNSDNLLFYIILKTTASANTRRLATVDPSTGICTDIGDMGSNFSSLTYSSATSTLYAMGGTGSTAPAVLCSVNINTGAATFLAGPFPLGNNNGAIIAYNYIDGLIYHWSGYPVSSMEKINLGTFTATPVTMSGVSTSEVFGAVFTGTGDFIVTDFDYKAYTITSTGITSLQQSGLVFQVRGLGYIDALLPVELASFVSSVNGNNVTLNWTTSAETNNSGFDIERSSNGTWTKVGTVNGNGTTTTPINYSFTDRNIATGDYSYRLKQIDFNGHFEYFNLNNEVKVGIPAKFDLSQNYPNPFNPTTNLEFGISELGFVTLNVYNTSGIEVARLVNEQKAPGYYIVSFNGANLSSGIYFYTLKAGDFVSTKKMTLIK